MTTKAFKYICTFLMVLAFNSTSQGDETRNTYVSPEDKAVNKHLFETQKRIELNRLKSRTNTMSSETHIPKQYRNYDPNPRLLV